MLSLRDVSRVHGSGATAVHALRGISLDVAAGGARRRDGSVRLGQVDTAQPCRRSRRADLRRGARRGHALAGLTARELAAVRRRSVGYVFQELNLIPALTAVENVALPRELDGVSARGPRGPRRWRRLHEVGLDDLADRFPDELSGGQQQRVAIARALVGRGGWCWPTSRPARSTP